MRPDPATRPVADALAPPLPPAPGQEPPAWRTVLEHAALREILMGAQDNLTNVLAVVLGVAIGAGRSDLVALAGSAAAIAEAVSMGGVLYSSSRAEQGLRRMTLGPGSLPETTGSRLSPALSGLTTFAAALLEGLVPLAPFWVLPFSAAAVDLCPPLGGRALRAGGTDRPDQREHLVARRPATAHRGRVGGPAAAAVGAILRTD